MGILQRQTFICTISVRSLGVICTAERPNHQGSTCDNWHLCQPSSFRNAWSQQLNICKPCPQYSSRSMNLWAKGVETNVSNTFHECCLTVLAEGKKYYHKYIQGLLLQFLHSYILLTEKDFGFRVTFLYSSYMFHITPGRRQTFYFYFCCKGTIVINGHIQIEINYE